MAEPASLSESGKLNEENLVSDSNSLKSKNQELLVMTVEIGDGRQDMIVVCENDDPLQLAREFARKHNLDQSLQQALSDLIKQNKETIEKQMAYATEGRNFDFLGSYSSSQRSKEAEIANKKSKIGIPAVRKSTPSLSGTKNSQGSVYDRLTKISKTQRPNSSASTAQLSISKSPSNSNYGE